MLLMRRLQGGREECGKVAKVIDRNLGEVMNRIGGEVYPISNVSCYYSGSCVHKLVVTETQGL